MRIDEALKRARMTLDGMMIPGSEAEKLAAVKATILQVEEIARAAMKKAEKEEEVKADDD